MIQARAAGAILTATLLWGAGVWADDFSPPPTECSDTSAATGGSLSSNGYDDASGVGQVIVPPIPGLAQTLADGVVRGVVNGSRHLGDLYGRNVPADWWGWAPGTPSAPPTQTPSSPATPTPSDDPPLANNGYGVPFGDDIARGAWTAGNWAGTPSAPAPNEPDTPRNAPDCCDSGGTPVPPGNYMQPMVR